MTTQAPEQLINHFKEIDFGSLKLYHIYVGDINELKKKQEYQYKTKPTKAPGCISSACWRGFVAHYELSSTGTLKLIKYRNLAGKDQDANELLTGNFWMEFGEGEYGENIFVPFVDGIVVTDVTKWFGNKSIGSRISNCSQSKTNTPTRHIFDADKIKNLVIERNITHLVHFTRIDNLNGILKYGLMGRHQLMARKIHSQFNDEIRVDYLPDSICLSISLPNYKMFYSCRQRLPDIDWAVIRLDPSILWEKNFLFCYRNAAEQEIAHLTHEQRAGLPALQKMFEDQEGFPLRSQTRVDENCTTHPQAEVLVQEPIESRYIVDVLVDQKERIKEIGLMKEVVREHHGNYKFLHGKRFFDARPDYAHWK